jgi:hypothetical protein
MKNTIELQNGFLGHDVLKSDDLKYGVKFKVYSDVHDLLVYNNQKVTMSGTVFNVTIECIKNENIGMFFEVPMDELEMFAYSVLKHVEIVKNKHAEDLKKQLSLGNMDY